MSTYSPQVALARASFEHYVRTGTTMQRPADVPSALLEQRAGVFVTLHMHGHLRGCIGTITPTTACVADEIIQNAVSAAAHDPRFSPVREEELPHIECSVDVLGTPEDIDSPDQLDVKEYGVIVSRGRRRGLLLPNLEGVDTVAEQIDIARQKAGIARGEPFQLQRFRVVRYH
ncbi:MAG: AmmeMemoRadiSam system protein A [Christensenellales bacterium]|jgi:AmmeMemoRadiSam system protein A